MQLLKNVPNKNITKLSFAFILLTGIISCFVMVSWIFKADYLLTLRADGGIIKFNAAICFLAAAVSFGLVAFEKYKNAGIIIAITIFVFNLINISQYYFDYNLGIDELLIKDHYTQPGRFPGRIGINSSSFFLFISFFTISIALRLNAKITDLLIPPFWASTVLTLIAYGYGFTKPEVQPNYQNFSLIAILECFFLSTSILIYRKDEGFLAPFIKNTETAKYNGRMLIYGIFLTLFFGWLRLRGELSGLLQHDFSLGLMAGAYILIIMYFTKITTVKLNDLEQSLKKEKALSEQIINSLPAVFFVTDENNKFIRFNNYLVKASGYTKEELEEMTPHHFFTTEEKSKMDQYLKDINEKGLMTIEASLKDKEGVTEPFFFKTMTIEYDGQSCLIGTGINIAERKKAENEIELLNKELRNLSKHLDNIREEERTSIAREIHDELGQQLTVFKINLAWLQSLPKEEDIERKNLTTEMLALTESMIHSIRRIAHDLRPPALEDLGLAEALRIYSDEFEIRSGVSIHFFTELDMLELSLDTSKALYRIYQESLTNIARYANAGQVEASLDLEDENIILSVSDNGVGFNVEELIHKKTLGIIGMRERAVMIGGQFKIISQPNKGTTVLVTIPLEQDTTMEEELYNKQTA